MPLPCLLGSMFGCAPDFDDRPYLVEEPRLLAVVVEPPEARPRDEITVSPIVAGKAPGRLTFRFCTLTRPPADPRPVAAACLDDAGVALEPRGAGAQGAIPADACARFGPDPVGGSLRPVDADAGGGFYQPLIVSGLGPPSVAFVRVHCPLPDAPADVARVLEERYQPNKNPSISELLATLDGAQHSAFSVPASRATELRVTFPEAARESYVSLPPDARALEARTESLRVGWFVSNGVLASSTTGAGSAGFSANELTPNTDDEQVDLWAVLQDSRGGTAAKHWRFSVER